MLKIAIIAGEASGDLLAASFMAELKNKHHEVAFMGIGGPLMEDQGLVSSYDMETLSVGGYYEVIKSLPQLLWIRHQIIKKIIAYKPDVFIGVDAPDFTLYVEKILKQHGIKTVHYISPTIWAWRYNRIFKIKKSTDLMLCILPMEEAIYRNEGINAKFVGHPLAQAIEMDIDTASYREKLNLAKFTNVFGVLVGSRLSEIKKLSHILIASCNIIARSIPDSVFLFPFVTQKTYDLFQHYLSENKIEFDYKLYLNNTSNAIKASDLVIAKSGTVSLEVALFKKPMIIIYKLAKITAWLVERQLKSKYVGQPNILLDKEVAKELLQDDATPEKIASNFIALYNDKEQQLQIKQDFYKLHNMLKQDSQQNAAQAVLELIGIKVTERNKSGCKIS